MNSSRASSKEGSLRLRAAERLLHQFHRDDRRLRQRARSGARRSAAGARCRASRWWPAAPPPRARRSCAGRVSLASLGQEMRDQQRDVLAPAVERRHFDVHDVQPVVQVLAELPAGQQRCRSRCVVEITRTLAAMCSVLPTGRIGVLLQQLQQLHLQPHRQVADLIEQQRAAFGAGTAAVLRCAVEQRLRRAEQLALEQFSAMRCS